MGGLFDAIDRLNNALDEAERRQRVRELIDVLYGLLPLLGFPLYPDDWGAWSGHTSEESQDHETELSDSEIITFGSNCNTWKNNQDPG